MDRSSILYANSDATVILVDIPCSIESAQEQENRNPTHYLFSSAAPLQPFPSTEPKSAKAKARLGVSEPSLSDQLLRRHLELALQDVRESYTGPWCRPRYTSTHPSLMRKRKREQFRSSPDGERNRAAKSIGFTYEKWHSCVAAACQCASDLDREISPLNCGHGPISCAHVSPSRSGAYSVSLTSYECSDTSRIHGRFTISPEEKVQCASVGEAFNLPPGSRYISGTIEATTEAFKLSAPKFDLVVMDPPWPNKSALRKRAYTTAPTTPSIKHLLSLLPLPLHLTDTSLVAIWITNKPAFRALVLDPTGLFDAWGVTLVEEWVWLKTTLSGDPIQALDSAWRKPWEVLLVGKRGVHRDVKVKRRVVIAVPDLHSRKPCLKMVFDAILKVQPEGGVASGTGSVIEGLKDKYQGLEIFARNLTSGWWSWGDEVLKFQDKNCWIGKEEAVMLLDEQEQEKEAMRDEEKDEKPDNN
ncbi:hypothetical protein LZ554_003448 [Drepanopeziza brunnea f. sp. 'monogermtubi']|nr:hypothetical protein LZ554_003448 [Drepanopeziza brunnea f. sp. 'monogermtubi']